jgi:putative membrane protein
VRWIIRVLISWAVIAVAFYVTTLVITGIHVSGGVGGYLRAALFFGLVNAIIGPIARVVTFPVKILTLGLFTFILNAALLWLVTQLPSDLTIDHFFWDAIFGAVVIGLVSWALNTALHRKP